MASDAFYCAKPEFSIRCDKRWETLAETRETTVKHCQQCDRNVFLAITPGELERIAQRGDCAAYLPEVISILNLDKEQVMMVGQPKPSPYKV